MSVTPLELQALLRDERWIRALARRLARDASEADDLVQEAWLAWMVAPRPLARSRQWFAGVLRHLSSDARRERARRERREQAVARREDVGPAHELLAELELQTRVGQALLALEEPYRGTLVRRFHRGETLAEIARAEGLAPSSVHQRIQVGLARLRERLDREHGGRREAWAGVALRLVPARPTWRGFPEAMAMAAGGKLAAAVAVLVAGTTCVWWWSTRASDASESRVAAATAPAPGVITLDGSPAERALETRAAREEVLPAPPSSETAAAEPVPVVRGRVVTLANEPAAGVVVAWEGRAEGISAPSTSDGAFELPLSATLAADARIEVRDESFATVVPGRREVPLVVVAGFGTVAGVVVGPENEPVAGAELSFRVRERLFRELGLVRPDWPGLEGRWRTTSDARGRFELVTPVGAGLFLAVDASGYGLAHLDLGELGGGEVRVTLPRSAEERLVRGLVLTPDGKPCAGAEVSAGEHVVVSDEQGVFALTLRRFQPGQVLLALAPPLAPARVVLDRAVLDLAALEVPLVLRLGEAPLSIEGRVLDPEGRPRAGVLVYFLEGTRFGLRGNDNGDESGAWRASTVEEELGGRCAVSGADGGFALEGLLEREYALRLHDPRSLTRTGPWSVAAGARGVELVLAPEPGTRRVAGRVVRPDGTPLAGVEVRPRREADRYTAERPPASPEAASLRVTDAEGRFEFEALVTPGSFLELDVPNNAHRAVALDGRDLEALTLEVALLCELQVDPTRAPGLADHMQVQDARGRGLDLVVPYGNVTSFEDEHHLGDGPTSVLLVPETARTLVLLAGGEEVLRLPLALDPAQRTTITL